MRKTSFHVRIWYCVDYDLQVALMEALCRMTPRAQRGEMADRWFRMEFVATAFSQIKDSEFETVSLYYIIYYKLQVLYKVFCIV